MHLKYTLLAEGLTDKFRNFFLSGAVQCLVCQLLHLSIGETVNHAAGAGDGGCAHRELIQAKTKQHRCGHLIASHLTAHTAPAAMLMSTIDRMLDQTENRRIQRLIQVGYLLGHTVCSHRVLDQVIRSDGEEVCFFRDLIGENCSSRDLDHASDFDIIADLDALCNELFTFFVIDCLCFTEFIQRCNHREHDAELAECGGTEQSSQLYPEDILAHQAEAD